VNDFEFLVGAWDLANRRLKKALAGCTEWEEFPSSIECISLLGGMANLDEVCTPSKDYSAMTLRLFNPEREEWSLYSFRSTNPFIDTPVVGRFTDGVGRFCGDDTFDGKPIRVRFLWSDITPTSAHWEQAFSVDNAETWETNWMNDLTRTR
jgi:hypothetical protein